VRKGELENVERNRDKSLGVTVYIGQRRGNASTSDFSAPPSSDRAGRLRHRPLHRRGPGGRPARRRRHRAGQRAARPGPVPPLGRRQRTGRRTRAALRGAAFDTDKRITNSEGAGVSAQQSHFFSAHTHGFRGGYASSRHSISVAPIAGKGDDMQRDAWYSSMRSAAGTGQARGGGPLCRRARAVAPEVAQDRHARVPGAVRVAAGRRPAGRLRAGHQRRLAVPQEQLPARLAGQAGLPEHIDVLEDPHVRAARAARRSTKRACAPGPQGGGRRPRGGLFPVAAIRPASWA
jgi:PmbA protein